MSKRVRDGRAQLLIRPERLDDARAVALVHVTAWRVGYAGILPGEVLAALDVDEWATRRRGFLQDPRPGTGTLVADADAGIVGFITFGPDDSEPVIGRVWACYVDPGEWGTGVADRLITAAVAALPHRTVRLWVLADNHRARRFYERHGFAADGADDVYRPAGSTAEVTQVRYSLHR